ncbi:hypothetical protein G9444_4855 [Rhodococcus erythropolis]|uniref:Uncharacterized protein n=2 Tax=Bacillati TaxID=1783272 RepID=A0A6G9CYX4_RHOER|nr:hypothetical protein G9444_4855 [Rhodococcus erythropolis]
MAARVSTIWFLGGADARTELSRYPQPDQTEALKIAMSLYPDKEFESLGPQPLSMAATVSPGYVFVGAYGRVSVVCSSELSTFVPSKLPDSWHLSAEGGSTLLISSVPETAQGSFALWEDGELRRSFSAIPIDIVENLGIPQTWELEFWAGNHPLRYPPGILPDPQSLPFHPQQFAESANLEWLGFRYTGAPREHELDTTQILLWGFKIHRPGEAPKPAPPAPAPMPEQAPTEVPMPENMPPIHDAPVAKPRGPPRSVLRLQVAPSSLTGSRGYRCDPPERYADYRAVDHPSPDGDGSPAPDGRRKSAYRNDIDDNRQEHVHVAQRDTERRDGTGREHGCEHRHRDSGEPGRAVLSHRPVLTRS